MTRAGAAPNTGIPQCDEPCAIERGMRLIGGKWKGSILWHLREEPLRFNELARRMGGASRKMLSDRLTEMTAIGLVEREVLSSKPIAVRYSVTEFGRSTLGILEQLKEWAEAYDI